MTSTLMKKSLGLLALSALGLMTSAAQADWEHRDHGDRHAHQQSRMYSQQINDRQDRQMERIRAGMHHGQLNRAEFRELMHEQHQIRAMERHFRADGNIDAREFKRLAHALDIASRNIKEEKHDRQARNAYGQHPRFN